MERIKNVFLFLLLLVVSFQNACFPAEDSWVKPYRSNFKSPENYTSIKRFNQIEAEERYKIQQRNNVASILKIQQQENARLIEEHAQKLRATNLPKSIPPSAIKNVAPKIKPPEKMRINFEGRKVEAVRWEIPKPVTPQRNVTVEKKFIDGRQHTLKTVERFDRNGNLTRRDVVDRVRLDKRTTLTVIKTYSPTGDLIRQIEKFKIKGKGGYQVQKFMSTQFDVSGNPLNKMLVKNEFKRTGFFNSTFGKMLGIGLVVGAAILAPAMLGVAAATTAATVASAVGSGLAQFGLSLAQGVGFKEALKAAGISMAATAGGMVLGPQIASMLGKIPGVGNILSSAKNVLTIFGDKISSAFGASLKNGVGSALAGISSENLTAGTFLQKFTPQFSLRIGSEVFADKFSKKLGIFATVATLSIAGTLANSVVSTAVGAPLTQFHFSQQFANSVFSGLLQGAVAESLKNSRSPAAQFLRELGSSTASNISLSNIAESFNKSWAMRVANELFKNEGVTISDIHDAVVLKDSSVLILYEKNKTLNYALIPLRNSVENKTTGEKVFDLGKDILLSYDKYQSVSHSNFIGVGGADSGQILPATQGKWKDRSPDKIHLGNVTYGDPAHYHNESGVGYILEELQKLDFSLRKEYYQQAVANGEPIDETFLMPFPRVFNTVKADGYTFTGRFNDQKLPIIEPINQRTGISVHRVSSPAYYFSPGNPEQLANAIQQNFRFQDVNVVIGHSYGATTAVEAARILENRGVRIDYLVLIDPSGKNLEIPSNVANTRLFYGTKENRFYRRYLVELNEIKTISSVTKVLPSIGISKSHINIDNDSSIRAIIKNDYSIIFQQRTQEQLFWNKYGQYFKKLVKTFNKNSKQ